MDIKRIIEFIQSETTENEVNLLAAYQAIDYMLSEEQKIIDCYIPQLISNRDYDRVNKYVEMSKIVSETYLNMLELAQEYGLDINKTMDEEKSEKREIVNEVLEDDIELLFLNDKKINYENYRVDESVAYEVMTDFCHMKPAAFSLDGIRYPARLWKLVLLKTCELLWKKNHNIFEDFLEDKFMQGKTRKYFSVDNSDMTRPELINGTDIFVETNLSANNVRDVIIKMLDKYRIPHVAYKIYLSKDLNPLHTEKNKSESEKIKDSMDEELQEISPQDTQNLNIQYFCADYDYKTQRCMNEDSPYFIMECCKKENCNYIKNVKIFMDDKEEVGDIYIISKTILKKKTCPYCKKTMKGTRFSLKCREVQETWREEIYGCLCENCGRAYITEGAYHLLVKNGILKNIRATFITEENI